MYNKNNLKRGDIVITDGYNNRYDGHLLEITKITENQFGHFDPVYPSIIKKEVVSANFFLNNAHVATEEEIINYKNHHNIYIPKKGDWVLWTSSEVRPYQIYKIKDDRFYILYNGKKADYQNYSVNVKNLRSVPISEVSMDYHKEKLIKGNWYRSGNWFTKFDRLEGNKVYGEHTNADSKFYDKMGYLELNNYDLLPTTDLSDIQKCLPIGHVDKNIPSIEDLPSKWCIRVTTENKNALNSFYRKHIVEYKECRSEWEVGLNGYFHYPQEKSGCHTTNKSRLSDYTEITFEQFKKWVLKDDVPTEYVKCVKWKYQASRYTVGKIYKINDKRKAIAEDGNNYAYSWDHISTQAEFIKSTKEEYDAQPKNSNEMLVHGRYKIGDIVVSLNKNHFRKIGDLFVVLHKSTKTSLWYTPHVHKENDKNSGNVVSQWRAATEEEANAYRDGITNINQLIKRNEEDLTGRYLKALVNSPQGAQGNAGDYYRITKTGNETVSAVLLKGSNIKWSFDKNMFDKEVKLMSKEWSPTNDEERWYLKEDLTEKQFNALIAHLKKTGWTAYRHCCEISYEEFVRHYDHIRSDIDQSTEKRFCLDNNSQGIISRRTFSDFNLTVDTHITREELMSEAKRRYPIGTKFTCVNGNPIDLNGCVINSHDDFKISGRNSSDNTFGIHHGNNWVVLNGKWAEIVKKSTIEIQSPTDHIEALSYDFEKNSIGDWINKMPEPFRTNTFIDHFRYPYDDCKLTAKVSNHKAAILWAFDWNYVNEKRGKDYTSRLNKEDYSYYPSNNKVLDNPYGQIAVELVAV